MEALASMSPQWLRSHLIGLPRWAKQSILVSVDVAILVGTLLAAIFVASRKFGAALESGWVHLPLAVALTIPLLAQAGFYNTIIRFVGSQLHVVIFTRLALVVLILSTMRAWLDLPGLTLPRPTLLLFGAFAFLGLVSSRLLMRAWLLRTGGRRERVIIYGAGNAGARLLAAIATGNRFHAVAMVDDAPDAQRRLLGGVRIWSPDDLPRLIADYQTRRVLLALPSVSRHRRQQIINDLAALPVHVQTMPDIADLVGGRARVDDLRDVDVMDLLGRDPVPPNETLLARCIRGKSVMITGAGGSIGSELCRQIIQLQPRRLVLFDLSELALYNIENELRMLLPADSGDDGIEIIGLLGSVHHRERVRGIMQAYGVQTVYHAAAYKHVPIVEHNMVEGIHNNIIGTWYTAEAAEDAGVETFVLISTDKAVSPVNVMGATKRFAELVLQGMAARGSRTRFCMVRFGNVLESSGSVVPLFREQIRRGGPVTVTHPEVIRYFMTIPEAAQLVIQAGSMGEGGDVFVLDMGSPVRIADLARRMIKLTGLTVRERSNPDGDITIEYTGLRHGEKLYEELLIGNNVARTEHPMIMRAVEESLPWQGVRQLLSRFLVAANAFDCSEAFRVLLEGVNGYEPVTEQIEDLVWRARLDGRSGVVPAHATVPVPAAQVVPVAVPLPVAATRTRPAPVLDLPAQPGLATRAGLG